MKVMTCTHVQKGLELYTRATNMPIREPRDWCTCVHYGGLCTRGHVEKLDNYNKCFQNPESHPKRVIT